MLKGPQPLQPHPKDPTNDPQPQRISPRESRDPWGIFQFYSKNKLEQEGVKLGGSRAGGEQGCSPKGEPAPAPSPYLLLSLML